MRQRRSQKPEILGTSLSTDPLTEKGEGSRSSAFGNILEPGKDDDELGLPDILEKLAGDMQPPPGPEAIVDHILILNSALHSFPPKLRQRAEIYLMRLAQAYSDMGGSASLIIMRDELIDIDTNNEYVSAKQALATIVDMDALYGFFSSHPPVADGLIIAKEVIPRVCQTHEGFVDFLETIYNMKRVVVDDRIKRVDEAYLKKVEVVIHAAITSLAEYTHDELARWLMPASAQRTKEIKESLPDESEIAAIRPEERRRFDNLRLTTGLPFLNHFTVETDDSANRIDFSKLRRFIEHCRKQAKIECPDDYQRSPFYQAARRAVDIVLVYYKKINKCNEEDIAQALEHHMLSAIAQHRHPSANDMYYVLGSFTIESCRDDPSVAKYLAS